MGRRIKRESKHSSPTTKHHSSPAVAPASRVSFKDELAAVLEPLGLSAADIERGGVRNPFAAEDTDGFRPFEPGEFVWPHASLRGVEHRSEIERYLWPHRRFFSYVPRTVAA